MAAGREGRTREDTVESVRVAGIGDIPPGSMRQADVRGVAVLVANVGGVYYAVANTCSHRGGNLSKGTIEDGIVTCPRHHSRFDVRTGKNLSGPRILGKTWKTGDVRPYPVRVEGGDVVVDLV
jgi:3-phenylpropionate/trans-cinnamate dioxygenase ferredoxin component